MHKWLVLVLSGLVASLAWAQDGPLPAQEVKDPLLQRQQKRLDLRKDVSSASRRSAKALPSGDTAGIGYQMSSQDRAEMREQLRHFQPASALRPQQP